MKTQIGINHLTIEEIKKIVNDTPTFIRNSLIPDETMYNPRTETYIERGAQSVLIQLDKNIDDYYRSTMPYHSCFYEECIYLNDLRNHIDKA